jgi:glyoxylase-like metal-dependent hydrolase (beta-lactamase superfamily II)
MKIARAEYNLFGVNTYIVWNTDTLEAAVIDPGMQNPDECFHFKRYIEQQKLQIVSLINTHLHIDHTLGNEFIEDTYGVGLTAHPADAPLGASRAQQAAMFHLRGVATTPVSIDIEVKAGDKIYLGDEYMEVIEVPGHSPGSIALYCAADRFVITGDALFKGSIGRTDLPGGNHATLVHAVTDNLLSLPDNTVVYPGHGPSTTIRDEKATNPYL